MATGFHFKGTIAVLVDPSRLEARLAVSREGDLEYDEGALVRILADAGVIGFDVDELVDSVKAFQKSKDHSVEIVAARGEAPVPPSGEGWQWEELDPLP